MIDDGFGPRWVGQEGFVGGTESSFGDVREVSEEVGVADPAVGDGGRKRRRRGEAITESGLFRCGCGRGGGCGG